MSYYWFGIMRQCSYDTYQGLQRPSFRSTTLNWHPQSCFKPPSPGTNTSYLGLLFTMATSEETPLLKSYNHEDHRPQPSEAVSEHELVYQRFSSHQKRIILTIVSLCALLPRGSLWNPRKQVLTQICSIYGYINLSRFPWNGQRFSLNPTGHWV